MLIFSEIWIYINLNSNASCYFETSFSNAFPCCKSHYFIGLSVTTQEFPSVLFSYLLDKPIYLSRFKHYTAPGRLSVKTIENAGVQLNLSSNKYLTWFIDLYLR